MIEVECYDCGRTLDVYVLGGHDVLVRPCEGCISEAIEEGRQQGLDEANDSR